MADKGNNDDFATLQRQRSKTLTDFTTRLRQLLLHYQELRRENEELKQQLAQWQAKVSEHEALLDQTRKEYETLKMAKMLTVSDGDLDNAKRRLGTIIRELDKCITRLSG